MKRIFHAGGMYKSGLWQVVLKNEETGELIVVKKDLHSLDARQIAQEWNKKFAEYPENDQTTAEFLTSENNQITALK